jgi:hypothetical protein
MAGRVCLEHEIGQINVRLPNPVDHRMVRVGAGISERKIAICLEVAGHGKGELHPS